jgi:hypothetical protein
MAATAIGAQSAESGVIAISFAGTHLTRSSMVSRPTVGIVAFIANHSLDLALDCRVII